MKKLHIAIDGPAGAGKSTVARILADKLKINYLDTGAMYRALTYHVLELKINIDDTESIISEARAITLDFHDNNIYLNDNNIADKIRTAQVNQNVSVISSIPEVRRILVNKQQEIANNKSVVMDGRDIATVVLPHADFKFFIDASIDVRAKRRYLELKEKGESCDYNELKNDIAVRDCMDSSRIVSPLKKAKDSIIIDTSDLTVDGVVSHIIGIINNREENNAL